ncbi:Hypothetical predicted protein [Mytilus galloprovincialis]|uniref:Reverse transcriptase domain-containing protein n=1 Tax=Mytilus galloprovincialis TaxID=29158 RepID=A0A8B6E414_MYTGA|nr:Hypothetical predicted protein [Mytilus galloprovincialis]
MVDQPTRYRINQEPSLLDLVLVNDKDFINNIEYQEPVGHSDHNVLVFEYKCYIKQEVSKSEKFNYFKADFEMLRQDLNVNWEELLADKTLKKRKSKSGISELHDKRDGKTFIASNDTDKAEILAEFFTSVFTKEDDEDETFLKDIKYDEPSSDEVFKPKEINKLLKNLNTSKSPGPKVLYELADIIDIPLCIIFNSSFSSGIVPEGWKIGQITALFKKGDKKLASNYRPVSLTSIICKIMEKLIRKRIVDHMNKYGLFSDRQFGFIGDDQQDYNY